ncbi:uncharacterized protein DDB_G0284459-like [Impatiens glandulifera]|uniref:uncharacterized protein DDB_G0284459-like n=1 Tax=Impatiens glandulifera TaxID=253017 RepID=UPI001FB0C942|nr:uncharacterized protein DDB_G0284459-like [Impatiens glandulifera]
MQVMDEDKKMDEDEKLVDDEKMWEKLEDDYNVKESNKKVMDEMGKKDEDDKVNDNNNKTVKSKKLMFGSDNDDNDKPILKKETIIQIMRRKKRSIKLKSDTWKDVLKEEDAIVDNVLEIEKEKEKEKEREKEKTMMRQTRQQKKMEVQEDDDDPLKQLNTPRASYMISSNSAYVVFWGTIIYLNEFDST